ncbi:MAG TPA: hypothetical protein HPP94_06520 [Desulfuromonadales bacterium]|nr:hypothetical protein [Desulfuromonadales bacterium]
MKLGKIMATAAALVTLASSAALATPSTQIWIPSTDVKGFKEVNIGIDNYIRFSDEPTAGANTFDVGITAGILPLENFKIEIGVDYMTDNLGTKDSIGGKHPIYFNAKAGIPEDAFGIKGLPAVAGGIYNIGTYDKTDGNTMQNMAYGLIAKTLPVVGRISVGGYNGAEKNLGKNVNSGILASWDRSMPEISDKLWLAVDYMSGKNFNGAVSFGGSWAFSKQVSLIVGLNVYNPFQSSVGASLPGGKPTFTTQLDINLP